MSLLLLYNLRECGAHCEVVLVLTFTNKEIWAQNLRSTLSYNLIVIKMSWTVLDYICLYTQLSSKNPLSVYKVQSWKQTYLIFKCLMQCTIISSTTTKGRAWLIYWLANIIRRYWLTAEVYRYWHICCWYQPIWNLFDSKKFWVIYLFFI